MIALKSAAAARSAATGARVITSQVPQNANFVTSAAHLRWDKDVRENSKIFGHGYQDKVKQSGALPRISNDEERWDARDVYAPENPWALKRALFGQNDYIDILGEDPDMFRPSELNYEQPEWLREVPKEAVPYQRLLMKKKLLQETDFPETHPKTWEQLVQKVERIRVRQSVTMDQYQFANYRGIAVKDARGEKFRTKYPF